jgi:two-component system nitrate/nitrite response regulator NarL
MREPSDPARVFIVASNRPVREALARAVAKRPEFVLGGTAPFSPEALGLIVSTRTRILLFEPPTKSLAELDFICEVRRSRSGLKVVLVGMTEDESAFLAAVQAGVTGYLLEDASAGDIVAAARALLREEAVCPPRLCHALFTHVAENSSGPFGLVGEPRLSLTRRQRQLVGLIAKGLTNKEIATQLNLSEQTVKNHIHNMLERAQADDRLALVKLAGRCGLLS